MLRLLTFILWIGTIQARVFNNPVLGNEHFRDLGAIKVNGTYYIVTKNMNYSDIKKFPIHSSTDLVNWKEVGYIFNENNYPLWSNTKYAFWGSTIHKINNNYNVYFIADDIVTGMESIGVAVAPHPLGPYIATDRPLLTDSKQNLHFPTIANDNGILYLIWQTNNIIFGRQLSSNGLNIASDQTIELLHVTLSWESYYVTSPWYLRRGDYHYIMYTGGGECKSQSIGVARSRNVLGPYEKLADPILTSNNYFMNPAYNSCFKDFDDQSDVIVFQTYIAASGCSSRQVINMASLAWNDDNWPYVYDY